MASVCEPLWGHPPLVATLLRQPQVTLRRECCDHAVFPDSLHLLQDQVHHAMVGVQLLYERLCTKGSMWYRPQPMSSILPARCACRSSLQLNVSHSYTPRGSVTPTVPA